MIIREVPTAVWKGAERGWKSTKGRGTRGREGGRSSNPPKKNIIAQSCPEADEGAGSSAVLESPCLAPLKSKTILLTRLEWRVWSPPQFPIMNQSILYRRTRKVLIIIILFLSI